MQRWGGRARDHGEDGPFLAVVWRQMSGRVGAAKGMQDAATSQVPGEPSSGIGPASIMNATHWPLQSYLELGALPSAVPSARLHARLVVGEWGLESIADTVELIVSELVTNGVKASRKLEHKPPVWLGLSSDGHQVLVAVWDGNEEPIQSPGVGDLELPDLEAEGGRGLLLVDSLSTDWGMYLPEGVPGKVVWSVITVPDAGDMTTEGSRHATQASLPRRVPSMYPMMRPVFVMGDLAVLKRVREGLKGLE
jgi:anti-sigma regulatory factor (Ser/Thr protein kinase)